MVEAVIFDRDGVLLDSEYTNVRTAELVFAELGITLSESQKQGIVGRHPDEYLIPFLQHQDIDVVAFKARQRTLYYEILQHTPVFERIIELVWHLKQRGLPLALCTSSSHEGTQKVLSLLGLTDVFSVIVAKGDYTKSKPNPEPYLLTAKRLGIPANKCLVIEDSSVGVSAAVAAGMKCIAVPNDYTRSHDFDGAIRVVGASEELNINELLMM